MPSPPATAVGSPDAGWYPDPLGPPRQLRWWDGLAWTAAVQTPPPPHHDRPRQFRARPWRRIGWAALGGFALAVGGTVYAFDRGQDVCEVSATGIRFCDEQARGEVEQGQAQLAEQEQQLQDEAREQAAGPSAADAVDLSGTWLADNGFTYHVEQFGPQAVITEFAPDGMTSAVGAGAVSGDRYTFDFQAADGSFGFGELFLDSGTLSGSFANQTYGITTPVVMRR